MASALARYPRDCGVVQDREGPPRKYSAVVIGVATRGGRPMLPTRYRTRTGSSRREFRRGRVSKHRPKLGKACNSLSPAILVSNHHLTSDTMQPLWPFKRV